MILPSPYWNKKRVLKGSKSAQNWPKYRCLRPPKKDQRRKLLLEVAAVWFVFERNASIFASETVFLHLPQIFHVSAAIIFNNSSWQQINSQLYLRGGCAADDDDKIMKTYILTSKSNQKADIYANSMLSLFPTKENRNSQNRPVRWCI